MSFEPRVPPTSPPRAFLQSNTTTMDPRFGHQQRHHASLHGQCGWLWQCMSAPTDVGSVSFIKVYLAEAYTKQMYTALTSGNVSGIHRSAVVLLTCPSLGTRWLNVRCSRNLMVTMACRCNPSLLCCSLSILTQKERR